jgi:hypothetical protein
MGAVLATAPGCSVADATRDAQVSTPLSRPVGPPVAAGVSVPDDATQPGAALVRSPIDDTSSPSTLRTDGST